MEDHDFFRPRVVVEDVSVPDGMNAEEVQYSSLLEDLESDAQDFEAPTWSLAVDQQFIKAFSKEAVKRQDVIHELVQTEINYVRTLKVILGVYVQELRSSQLVDESLLERLFPHVDRLLHEHQHFLYRLKQRRRDCLEPGSAQNYFIHRLGDLLISQFSDENGKKLLDSYGVFCSRHNEAVTLYKDLLQNNKKFQNLMEKIRQLSIVKRLGVPEGILLITQRITKYPVLVERIIKNTEDGSEEHKDLVLALDRIKETISQVDTHIHQYGQLREFWTKLDPKSMARTSTGQVFRRDDLFQDGRRVLREGLIMWKSPNRSKDVLVVLLPDLLLLLQDKDQKYIFASLEGKPAVLPLQNLLVREAAHDGRVMYLISNSENKADLYEFRTSSIEERTRWKQHIWHAIENCLHVEEQNEQQPESQEEVFSEKLRDFQEQLYMADAQIEWLLEYKLRQFSELAKKVAESPAPPCRLLLTGAASELQQGEKLLHDAIAEAEQLQTLLANPESQPAIERVNLPRREETIGGNNSDILKSLSLQDDVRNRNQRPNSDPQLRDLYIDSMELSADEEITPAWLSPQSTHRPVAQASKTAISLIQKLYSLQALIAQQDSEIELLCAAAAERERSSRQRGNMLLEQEKQRHLEKQREELAHQQQLHAQMKQEQAAWVQERQCYERERQAVEAELRQRQEERSQMEARLVAQQEKLVSDQVEYQQNLERLRDAALKVEKEREKIEMKLVQRNKLKYNTVSSRVSTSALESVEHGLPYSLAGDLMLSPKSHARPSLSQLKDSLQERPPLVPPRKESILVKPDVPVQLVSATNQPMTGGSVQQQIPKKLAQNNKKEGKGKSSHHRTNSAASIEVSVPSKVSGKEGGSLKARSSSSSRSSRYLSPDLYIPPDQDCNLKPPRSGTSMRKPSHGSNPNQHAHRKKENVKDHEDIMFF